MMKMPLTLLSDPEARLELRPVSRTEADGFSRLTAPALRWMLDSEDGPATAHGFCRLGAWSDGRAAGLLLSCPAGNRQELTSIMVEPSMRGCGIGGELMAAWKHQMRQLGRAGLFARWSSQLPRNTEFSRLLSAAGWTDPVVTRRRMTWRVGDWHQAFPGRDGVLRRLEERGLVVRSLAELGPEGTDDFVRQGLALIAAGEAPGWSNPQGWVETADQRLTVVLMDPAGLVHGWMVCAHQPQYDRWYVPQGWVRHDRIARGWLLGGMASLLQRLEAVAGPQARVIAQPAADVPGGMEQMLFKHFGNHTIAMDFLFESELLLGDA